MARLKIEFQATCLRNAATCRGMAFRRDGCERMGSSAWQIAMLFGQVGSFGKHFQIRPVVAKFHHGNPCHGTRHAKPKPTDIDSQQLT